MASRYDQAEVLTALWKLGAADNALLPTSHGILDRARVYRSVSPGSVSVVTSFLVFC